MRNLCALTLIAALWSAAAAAQQGREPAASTQGRIVVDNDKVIVRDVTWAKGQRSQTGSMRDKVVIILAAANAGEVTFEKAGAVAGIDRTPAAGDMRAIVIELKDVRVAPFPNASGYPNAFPRPGAKRVLDNDRVTAWDYTWTSGVASPVHFHDKDVVVVYLADGALTSTTPDGVSTVNDHSFGFTKFNPGNRVHSETLSRGRARAIIVELK